VSEASDTARRRVLLARARSLAAASEDARRVGERVLVFCVGADRYAVPVGAVNLVLDATAVGPLVGTPPWLLGAVQARGRIVPVVDLRELLGAHGGFSDLTRVIVVDHESEPFGIAAEVIVGEREFDRDDVSPAASGPFRWVASDRTALLDLTRLKAPGEG
jgi:purine-binding chemotaxis protein CheW